MGNRRRDFSRAALPMYSIRIRKRDHLRVRFIKIPWPGRGHRWVPLARFTWESTHGQVPRGMVVAHADADTLNDDPANYALMTNGDVVQLHLRRRQGLGTKMRTRQREALVEFNKLKGVASFFSRQVIGRWFPACTKRRTVFYHPCRKRWQVFLPWLPDLQSTPNGVISRADRQRIAQLGLVAVRGCELRDEPYLRYQLEHMVQPTGAA